MYVIEHAYPHTKYSYYTALHASSCRLSITIARATGPTPFWVIVFFFWKTVTTWLFLYNYRLAPFIIVFFLPLYFIGICCSRYSVRCIIIIRRLFTVNVFLKTITKNAVPTLNSCRCWFSSRPRVSRFSLFNFYDFRNKSSVKR